MEAVARVVTSICPAASPAARSVRSKSHRHRMATMKALPEVVAYRVGVGAEVEVAALAVEPVEVEPAIPRVATRVPPEAAEGVTAAPGAVVAVVAAVPEEARRVGVEEVAVERRVTRAPRVRRARFQRLRRAAEPAIPRVATRVPPEAAEGVMEALEVEAGVEVVAAPVVEAVAPEAVMEALEVMGVAAVAEEAAVKEVRAVKGVRRAVEEAEVEEVEEVGAKARPAAPDHPAQFPRPPPPPHAAPAARGNPVPSRPRRATAASRAQTTASALPTSGHRHAKTAPWAEHSWAIRSASPRPRPVPTADRPAEAALREETPPRRRAAQPPPAATDCRMRESSAIWVFITAIPRMPCAAQTARPPAAATALWIPTHREGRRSAVTTTDATVIRSREPARPTASTATPTSPSASGCRISSSTP